MPTYAEQVIADGASAYWRLNDAVGATTAASSVGGVAAGTITGGVTLGEPGPVAGATAMRFDGTSGRVTVPVGAYSAFGTGPLTLEMWVRLLAPLTGSHALLDTTAFGTIQPGAALVMSSTVFRGRIHNGTASQEVVASLTAALATGAWQHLVVLVTRGPDRLQMYLNGVLTQDVAVTSTGSLTATQATGIAGASNGGLFATIAAAEVALYKVALTPTQIATHYALAKGYLTYNEQVVADGASAYWRLNDAVGSATAASSVGGVAAGTIAGGVTLGEPGPIAGATAMRFDGVSGRVTVPVGAYSAFGTGPFTLECWARIDVPAAAHAGLIDTKNNGGTVSGALIRALNNGNTVGEIREGALAFNQATSTGDWPPTQGGRWRHVVLVMRRGPDALELWFDGLLRGTKTTGFVGSDYTTTSPTGLGCASTGTQWFLNGHLAEVALYKTALTPAQIATHYALAKGYLTYAEQVIADGASHYWRLGEPSGTTAVDSVGGANGTISGGVTLNQPGAIGDGDTAMAFNGTTGKVALPILTLLSGAVVWSLELWARRSDLVSTMICLQFGDANNYVQSASTNWTVSANITGAIKTTAFPLCDLQWHAVVVTGDGTNLRLYIDGVLRATNSGASGSLTTVSGVSTIGAYGSSLWWNGLLDDVAIYPRALTVAEIARHYAIATAIATPTLPLSWASFGVTEDLMVQAYNTLRAVTPSDTVDLPAVTQAIWVGGTGNVAVVTQNNVAATLTAVPAGAWLPIAARRINATNTTATAIVALYQQ